MTAQRTTATGLQSRGRAASTWLAARTRGAEPARRSTRRGGRCSRLERKTGRGPLVSRPQVTRNVALPGERNRPRLEVRFHGLQHG